MIVQLVYSLYNSANSLSPPNNYKLMAKPNIHKSEYTPKWKCQNLAQLDIFSTGVHLNRTPDHPF